MIQEQTASKEREERILAEVEAAKERDEKMLKIQQLTVDRLIVTQHRIDAILVQNYELHEYLIPRMFVILPDSYQSWDPRNSLAERFRLYFLCECGDHCEGDVTAATLTPTPVKNSLHLAKHEGYELSRSIEFFDRYGRYVLGMLQVLRHCLAVAAAVAPAVSFAEGNSQDFLDAIHSTSERTMEAVDMSIAFLQQRLGVEPMANGVNGINTVTQEEDMFGNLAALEGADLRQLTHSCERQTRTRFSATCTGSPSKQATSNGSALSIMV